MTKTAVIMMGIQGSGKSEFCKRLLKGGFVYISLDELNTRNKERVSIEQCFADGSGFVIDNTNPTRADRARYILPARENGYRVVGYYMQSELKACIARNNKRKGKACIPAQAIAATSNKMELPCRDEGFDELYYVKNDGIDMTVSEWRDENEF